MSIYTRLVGVDGDSRFPPSVLAALKVSLGIQNVGAPMTTAQRNALRTADLLPGYYIFNTDLQIHQIWRTDHAEWHDGLDTPGTQKWWAGGTIPRGWMKQNGASLSRSTYAKLYAVIGTTYGGGASSTAFNIPNTAGRTPIDTNGTHPLGQQGGLEMVTLTQSQMPSHTHTPTISGTSETHSHTGSTTANGSHNHDYVRIYKGPDDSVAAGSKNVDDRAHFRTESTGSTGAHAHSLILNAHTSSHSHTATVSSTGGGEAHSNMQPYHSGHFIIKY